MTQILGIDIGGSGIKGAPVDIGTGELLAKRVRLETPQPSTPDAVAQVVVALRDQLGWRGPVGATYPGVVRGGTVRTAANVDPSWLGVDAAAKLGGALGEAVTMVNDADAAGLAEVVFGAARDESGTVLMVTLGTGIGTALFTHGALVPNTELGHLVVRGRDAELRASARARTARKMSWRRWSKHVRRYLQELERLLRPDLFVLGGGVSKQFDRFGHRLKLDTPVVPAQMHNDAGIVGAALAYARAHPEAGAPAPSSG
jgi:polyphosphate glucokinase